MVSGTNPQENFMYLKTYCIFLVYSKTAFFEKYSKVFYMELGIHDHISLNNSG
jgi:hypothetical protein